MCYNPQTGQNINNVGNVKSRTGRVGLSNSEQRVKQSISISVITKKRPWENNFGLKDSQTHYTRHPEKIFPLVQYMIAKEI